MEKGNSVPEFVKIKSTDLLTCLHYQLKFNYKVLQCN